MIPVAWDTYLKLMLIILKQLHHSHNDLPFLSGKNKD